MPLMRQFVPQFSLTFTSGEWVCQAEVTPGCSSSGWGNGPDSTALQSSGSRWLLMDVIRMPGKVSVLMCQGVKLQVSGNTQALFCSTQYAFCVEVCHCCQVFYLVPVVLWWWWVHPLANIGCSLYSWKPPFFVLQLMELWILSFTD